ncbi:MAG: hypothetical protein JWQ90_3258 [Hydrocarboniphaga sp.]|uniref:TlpA family protein disulfide reductase n=1 Tax=Hydrocarboniphaga sp. TaxID=2033016 RepID=UPI00260E9A6E|nr:hypothetical protein [Hydrocarboniphaga sp.]MDB5970808.1 hypothetical protein [Hydrocarboniphaga sp.]
MRRRDAAALLLTLASVAYTAGAADTSIATPHLLGHFSDAQLGAIGSFSLPRTFVYDAGGKMLQPEAWPADLAEVKKTLGDAYCCVDDGKGSCVPIPYGEYIGENFAGLMDATQKPITLAALPRHRWLLVEYSASWCAPCVEETKALTRYFSSSKDAGQYVWLTIDMSRLIEAQDAARKAE